MPREPGTKTERDDHAPTEIGDLPEQPTIGAEPSPLARRIGRFRLDAPLGSGGMADVHRAYDPMLDRAVALKVLRTKRAGDDPQRMRRVLREARAAAALTHPNTVTIFDVGEADGEVFIAMELLEGEALRRVLDRTDVPMEQKLRWLLQAARALAAAHERGLVHRDVKPDNMFVCNDGTLKLLDFGIAKRDEDDTLDETGEVAGPSSMATIEGRRLGTPRYMAPEQHAGQSTDARTDEYAWGLVAFELLAGAHPAATSETATMADDGSPPPTLKWTRLHDLRARVPALPESIALAIVRALEPQKDDRFSSMAPIVAALEGAGEREAEREHGGGTRELQAVSRPPRAVAASSLPPTQSARSRRWILAAAVVATGALVAGGGAAVRAWLRARETAIAAATPACRVESKATLAIGPDDRAAALPDGTIVVARNVKRGVVLERHTPDGFLPFDVDPRIHVLADDSEDVELVGTTLGGAPTVAVVVNQGPQRGALLTTWTEMRRGGGWSMSRITGPVAGLSFAPFGKRLAVVVTTQDAISRPDGLAASAEIYVVNPVGGPLHSVIEHGAATENAVATSADRIAAAYVTRGALHYALLDAHGQRIGDAIAITGDATAPAVALVDETAVVLWVREDHGRRRLVSATLDKGAKAFAAPRVAVEDTVLWEPTPIATPTAAGGYVVAWVSSSSTGSTLRVAPLGASGVLTGVTDIDTASAVTRLTAVSTDHDVILSWVEHGTTMKLAHVTCGAR